MRGSFFIVKRIFVFSLIAIIILTSCKSNEKEKNLITNTAKTSYEFIDDINKIDGITSEDLKALEEIKKRHKKFTYALLYSTESYYIETDKLQGFQVELAKELSQLFEIEFEVKLFRWDQILRGMFSHDIDFTGEFSSINYNDMDVFFTKPVSSRVIQMYSTMGSVAIENKSRTQKLKFAFLDKTKIGNILKESYPHDFDDLYVGNYREAVEGLETGQYDAFFDDSTADSVLEQFPSVKIESFPPNIYVPVSLATSNKDLKPIIDIIDKYLISDGQQVVSRMYEKNYNEYKSVHFFSALSDEEKQYIENYNSQNAKVPILLESENYPYSFYNENEQEFQGIAIDILKKISTISGLQFEIANSKHEPFESLLTKLDNGEGSILSELWFSPAAKDSFIWENTPYTTDSFCFISKESSSDISISEIFSLKVGVVKHTIFEDLMGAWFPNHTHVTMYDTTLESFDALERGEVDVLLSAKNQLLYTNNYLEKTGFKINLIINKTLESKFGFSKNEHILASIIEKAQQNIDTELISAEWTSKSFDYRMKLENARRPIYFLFVLSLISMLIICMFFLRNKWQASINLENIVKERTRELEEQTETAIIASRVKSEFLSNMSHEMRTPLNAIIGMAEICKKTAENKEKMLNSIEEILKASRHLLKAVNNILDMSTIEKGDIEFELEPFSLYEVLKDIINEASAKCSERKINFNFNFKDAENANIVSDKKRFSQIVFNILDNAVKYTKTGGSVWFNLKLKDESDSNYTFEFEISDTGVGMTKFQIESAFRPFEQFEENPSAGSGGIGIGLSISQSLLAKMGSNIIVESEPLKGSKFSFVIKFKKHIISQAESAVTNLIDFNGANILVVDDVDINRIIVIELLSEYNLNVFEAENGKEALEIFEKAHEGFFSMIVMDIQMPVLDGYKATEAIRALDRSDAGNIPIIAFTANSYNDDIEKAYSSGMNDHIAKPIHLDVLLSKISKYF